MKRYVKFWGTRGSCPVSGPEYLHFGGNTPCLELVYDDVRMIFDAGTGIRPLGKLLLDAKVKQIDLFLSHTHWDHIQGFPFFKPIYHSDVHVNIWAPLGAGRSCHDLFQEVLAAEFFPLRLSELQAKLQFHLMEEQVPVQKGPITLTFHQVNHPGMTYCFKIQTPHQTIGYATDNEAMQNQTSLIEFFKDCDLLIHEAQYFSEEYEQRKGWGHSDLMGASNFVKKTRAKRWLISHHDPAHTDEELKQIAKLAQAECARDGQIVELQ